MAASPFAEMWLEKKGIKKKKDVFWLLRGIFNEYIKQNITMEVLTKKIYILLAFADWWKVNHAKKEQGEKPNQSLIFSKLPNCPWDFKKKECSACI